MIKHGLYEDQYYGIDKLNNFMHFLNSDLKINPSKTIKEMIIEATNYDEENYDDEGDVKKRKSMIVKQNLNKRNSNPKLKPIKNKINNNVNDDRYNMYTYLSTLNQY